MGERKHRETASASGPQGVRQDGVQGTVSDAPWGHHPDQEGRAFIRKCKQEERSERPWTICCVFSHLRTCPYCF